MFNFLIDLGLAVWGILGLAVGAGALWFFIGWMRLPRVRCDNCKSIVLARNAIQRGKRPLLRLCLACDTTLEAEARRQFPTLLPPKCDVCRKFIKEEGGLLRLINGMRICVPCAEAARR